MNSRHSLGLLIFILIGVVAGLFVGWYWGAAAVGVGWLGKLFLNTLSMLVIPLLVSAVISGVTSLVRLYINLYVKNQHVFLLLNDDLYFIYTFQIKSSLI